MNQSEGLKAIGTYFNLMGINGGSHIYRIANQVGIFSALQSKPLAANEVAEQCGILAKPAGLLLECLCGIDVVVKKDNSYELAPVMYFLSGAYSNLSDEYWEYLPEYLKRGEPIAKMDNVEQSEGQYVKQVLALSWMLKPAAVAAGKMLEVGSKRKGLNILDVGAGSAVWSLSIAQYDEESQVTALDWPKVLEIAEGQARECGMAQRFQKMPGNYHETELPADTYDMAIVGNVTHIETPAGNSKLMAKLYQTLKPGGEVVIFDILSTEEGKLASALYAMGLALRTEQGQVYGPEELKGFTEDAGFVDFGVMPIPVIPNTMGMFIARKPISR